MQYIKVKNNKTRDTEAADKAAKAKNEARRGSDKENESEGPEATDVLGEQEDNDVIF